MRVCLFVRVCARWHVRVRVWVYYGNLFVAVLGAGVLGAAVLHLQTAHSTQPCSR